MSKSLSLIALALLATMQLHAAVALPPFFSDNMVLQRNSEVKFWGRAARNSTVTIVTSWNGKTTKTTADAQGSWEATLRTPKAGGPYKITISDGEPSVLNNVLIGEVWLCTGQSNMELRIDDKVIGWEEEKANASKLTNVRLLQVEKRTSIKPTDDITIYNGGWQECSAESIANFTAAGYFFGKYLSEALKVPVGLIETCWGGTVAEAWTSGPSLRDIPEFNDRLDVLKDAPETKEAQEKLYQDQLVQWESDMKRYDKGFSNGKAVWGDPSFDDSDWTDCKVPGYLQEQKIDGMHDFFWMRKTIDIPASWAGKDLTLHVGYVDDNDYTYFNGTRVGHMEGCLFKREYKIPGSLVKAGKNTIAVRVMDTGGMSGINGDSGSIKLVKSGNEEIDLTGSWKCRPTVKFAEAPSFPLNLASEANYPSILYNAMIYPLRNYKVKGAIWYQGESNTSKAAQYKDLLPLMIRDWRKTFGCELPFYIVQLANYMKVQTGAEESEWAMLREAQLETSRTLENTGLAVTIDIGEELDIHPKNKNEVGRRLFLNAMAGTYGQNGLEYSGPIYEGYTISGNEIKIRFSHTTGGLKAYSYDTKSEMPVLEGFYIAGGDHVFHKADAKIEGDTVVVTSPDVPFPAAVRYAWANNPICNLYNGKNLPASPFRTDRW